MVSRCFYKMVKYSIVRTILLLLHLSIQIQICHAQDPVADVVLHLISIGSNYDMPYLTETVAPCPQNVSFQWTRLSAEIIIHSQSSWCTRSGYSSDGSPPSVTFGNGLNRSCSLTSMDFLDFHVSVSGLLSCDGNNEIAWPLCINSAPIMIDTKQITATTTQQICGDSFNVKYSYSLKCRNPNSFPPTCTAFCYPTIDANTCYTCLPDGTKSCCNSSYGGPNCLAGMTSGTTVADSTTTSYCPSSCYNAQPDNLQRTYYIPMIFCARIAGVLLILVIIVGYIFIIKFIELLIVYPSYEILRRFTGSERINFYKPSLRVPWSRT